MQADCLSKTKATLFHVLLCRMALRTVVLVSLHPEMGKSFIGFSHTVCVFFFLESCAFAFAGSYYFPGQFICHAASVPFATITNQPFYAQRYLPVWSDFGRYLESCS